MTHVWSVLQIPGMGDEVVSLGRFENFDTSCEVVAELIDLGSLKTYTLVDETE